MNEVAERKRQEKERLQRQEIEDDRKIHHALSQMREAFTKEENPREAPSRGANSSFSNHLPRSILKSQEKIEAPPSFANQNNTGRFSPSPIQAINVEPDYYSPPRAPSGLGGYGNEQLERLNRVQQEIDARNAKDRLETEKIFRDLVNSNRNMSMVPSGTSSPYNMQNFTQASNNIKVSYSPARFNADKPMSGNIRLETNFIKNTVSPI